MSDHKRHIEVKTGSEKGFGIMFSFVFAVIGVYSLVDKGSFIWWPFAISVVLLSLAYITTKTLAIPNKLWFKLGILLGDIVAPIIMALIYFLAVLPTGLIVRLMGKDLLRQRLDKNAKSYWVERDQPVGSMKDQF